MRIYLLQMEEVLGCTAHRLKSNINLVQTPYNLRLAWEQVKIWMLEVKKHLKFTGFWAKDFQ